MTVKTITTKELRNNLPKIKQAVDHGQSFVLIYRSKPFAQLLPLFVEDKGKKIDIASLPFVGMWKDRIPKNKSTAAFLAQLRRKAWGRL